MISQDTVRLLVEAARAAPSADNSQPWQFHCDASRFSCHYRKRDTRDPFGPAGHATLLSVGAVAENLNQVLGGRIDPVLEDLATGAPYFSLFPSAAEVATRSHPLFRRHTNRFPYQRQPLPRQLSSELAAMTEGSARFILLDGKPELPRFADIAEVCCRARFCNRELHEWLMGSLRWPKEQPGSGDGLDIDTLALPPGGRSLMRLIRPWKRLEFLNRLGLYRLMAHAEVQALRHAPLVACIVGDNNKPEGIFSAGRLMQRAWIMLNDRGWAVHPYYVVADQYIRSTQGNIPDPWVEPVAAALTRLAALLRLNTGEQIHMTLRVGLPTRRAPHSGRMPFDRLISPGQDLSPPASEATPFFVDRAA
ncbi:MAG: hypothetical protein Q8L56_05600 [Rhodocyclaceae bacterium]|nr:hypothetical protein [Rhodocyclaceae bacterium]